MANETRTASHYQFRNIFLVNATYWTTVLSEIRILVEQGIGYIHGYLMIGMSVPYLLE